MMEHRPRHIVSMIQQIDLTKEGDYNGLMVRKGMDIRTEVSESKVDYISIRQSGRLFFEGAIDLAEHSQLSLDVSSKDHVFSLVISH